METKRSFGRTPGARPDGVGLIQFSEFKASKGIPSDRIEPWLDRDGKWIGCIGTSVSISSWKMPINLAVSVWPALLALEAAVEQIRRMTPRWTNPFKDGGPVGLIGHDPIPAMLMPGEPVMDPERIAELKHRRSGGFGDILPLKPFTLTEEDLKAIQGAQLTKKQERKIARAEKKKQHVPKNLFKGKKR